MHVNSRSLKELVTQYHELLQKDIQTVLNAMQEATYKALNLQSVVNETSAKLEDIGIPEMISLIKTGLRWYFWFGLGVVFLVIGNAGIMTRFSMAARKRKIYPYGRSFTLTRE